ncbi:MAG: SIS domain-containing protein [Candidatus Helarchaeota archaeon]|nr:SIS domain-containing protein [Candidatus Helarchaeota archaeon]
MSQIGHLTLKEIEEQPRVIQKTIENSQIFDEIAEKINKLKPELIVLTGSGSSFNAGFASLYMLNQVAGIPTWVVHSSEFPYIIEPILKEKRHLLISISQSGESPGTVAAAKFAESRNISSIAVTAHPESPLAKTCSMVLPLITGEELSVMATKTYMAQIAALIRLAITMGNFNSDIESSYLKELLNSLKNVPTEITKMMTPLKTTIKEMSPCYRFAKHAFILGSGPDYATAMEAALKLKEGARITAEAYSAPEFRHGPITLADEYTMILGIIPHSTSTRFNSVNSLLEVVKQRHTSILGITPEQDLPYEFLIKMPHLHEELSPLINIVPCQILVHDIAKNKGYDPDNPKLLTKVVSEE